MVNEPSRAKPSILVTLFDGVCVQTKELQTLYSSMSDDVKRIISSSGRYMFVRFAIDNWVYSTGFLANIHYGKEILNKSNSSIKKDNINLVNTFLNTNIVPTQVSLINGLS